MHRILAAEGAAAGIDLAVFTGDQVTAGDVRGDVAAVWNRALAAAAAAGVPFATIFGNHDDEPLRPAGRPAPPPRLRAPAGGPAHRPVAAIPGGGGGSSGRQRGGG